MKALLELVWKRFSTPVILQAPSDEHYRIKETITTWCQANKLSINRKNQILFYSKQNKQNRQKLGLHFLVN